MSVTLGDMRTFAQENASLDASGPTADREHMVWINSALYRLYSETSWDHLLRQTNFTIVPRESLTDLVVTQGSLALSSATGFAAKYLSDRWGILIDGEERVMFELDAIGTPNTTATLRAGDEWIGASAVAVTAYFYHNKLPLPKVKEVYRVQETATGIDLALLTNEEFDRQVFWDVNATGSVPMICTWRRQRLEFWPHPADDYAKISVTYRLAFTPLTTADLGTTVLEWDEENRDLLEKAILLEASITQGGNAAVPFPLAQAAYLERLRLCKASAQKGTASGPMGVPKFPSNLYGAWAGVVPRIQP